MAAQPVLVSNQASVASPNSYTLPPGLDMQPTAVTAIFDGTASASAFLCCLSFYAQSGELMARSFPESSVSAGGSVEVSFSPFLGGGTTTTTGFGVPIVALGRVAVQSVGTAGRAAVSWDTAFNNPNGMWSAGTPTRINIVTDGLYGFSYEVLWAINATGDRGSRLNKNGAVPDIAQMIIGANPYAADQTGVAVTSFQVSALQGDYVELIVDQNSGGNLNMVASLLALRLRS